MKAIYFIHCTGSNKYYIGASSRTILRIKEHKRNLRKNKHISGQMQLDWNAYGSQAFIFGIIEYTENLETKEQFWCDFFKANKSETGYNKRTLVNSNKGNSVTISEETKAKISNSLKGKIPLNLIDIQKLAQKPVDMYIDGILIDHFPNQREASRQTGICHHAINNIARGKTKFIRTHPNHTFKYKI